MIGELTDIVMNAFNDTANVTADAGDDAYWIVIPLGTIVATVALVYLARGCHRKWIKYMRKRWVEKGEIQNEPQDKPRDTPYWGGSFYGKANLSEGERDEYDDYVRNKNFGWFDPPE